MNLSEQAIMARVFAQEKHAEQVDKAGNPYINHVCTVAEWSAERLGLVGEIIGWLHDVIEDTDATYQDLHDLGIDPVFIEAVEVLTRRHYKEVPEKYHADFIARVNTNSLAKVVKIFDLKHNLSRIENLPVEQQSGMRRRYEKALEMLGEKI